jgi:NAD(P)-dependent dehydrogenase (short-subunit alcohol dehydrogenase family)/nicotinamidase-related amidase
MNKLDAKTTAVVMVDLQKGILGFPTAPRSGSQVLTAAAALIARLRTAGTFIAVTRVMYAPDFADALRQPVDRPLPGGTPPPDWAELPAELGLQAGDPIIDKRQWGAFYGTDLDLQLRRRGIKTIILGGIATNMGVESTARDAWERNYNLIFASDTISGLSTGTHNFSMCSILPLLGKVRSNEQIFRMFGLGGSTHGELQDKVALVTGAARGIGEQIARTFAREGAYVVVADVNNEGGQRVAADVGGEFKHFDVTSERRWIEVLEEIRANYGKIDIIVNNAAIYRHNIPFLEVTLEVFRQHQTVNAESVFLGCKHGILAMREQRSGVIINMSSLGALMCLPDSTAYSVSKGAVLMLTRLASRVGGPYGIRVNAIVPGVVSTDMSREDAKVRGMSEQDYFKMCVAYYPLGRIGEAKDMADAALFLASERSSFITGQLLRVDGGQDP